MKKSIATLSLGLLAGLAGNTAFATTGSITFTGKITPETCPIEIIDPINPGNGDRVAMSDVPAGSFRAPGTEIRSATFAIRVPDKAECGIAEDAAFVRFDGDNDGHNNFRFNTGANAATGVSLVIKDDTNAAIQPGGESADYPLNDEGAGATDLEFTAHYRSTAASVTAGDAIARLQYTVDYR